MNYLISFIAPFILAIIFTPLIKTIAVKLKIVDQPTLPRKIHKQAIPLLGGLAVFLSFSLVLLYYSYFTDLIITQFIFSKHIIGIIIAVCLIMIGGILDDKYNLAPKYQIFFPVFAVLIVIAAGIGIDSIRNPFGGTISFINWQINLFYWQGLPYRLTLMADLFSFIWLLGMMFTTKLLDGLDGLVSGITVIGALVIFGIAISSTVAQYNTALLALMLAGAFAGFLIFNFNPAKIFLGEGGSLLAGFMLGVLAIISGSKVATTLLIMGIPILDVIWIIFRRLKSGKNPFKTSDRKHLHFRLLDSGLSQKQTVIFLYFLTALFGSFALFLQTFGKLIAFIILVIVMVVLGLVLVFIYQRKDRNNVL